MTRIGRLRPNRSGRMMHASTGRSGHVCLAILVLVLATRPAAADTYPRQPGVDAQHYAFRLTLRDDTDEISGEATTDLRFVRVGVTEVTLDLASAAGGKGMTVAAVTANGTAVKYAHA